MKLQVVRCLILLVPLLLASTAKTWGADITSFAQARDRVLAQMAGPQTTVLELFGHPDKLQAPVQVQAGQKVMSLGTGQGWLFAVRVALGEGAQYRVAFVCQDGSVELQSAKALPQGLAAIALQDLQAPQQGLRIESPDQAYARLLSGLLGHSDQGRRIYRYDAKVETPSVGVPSWHETIVVDGGPGWLFFVDDNPRANWSHACRYVLVAEDGGLHVVWANTPPTVMNGFRELTTWPEQGSLGVGLAAAAPSRSADLAAPSAAWTPAANRHAVIISGGGNQASNYPRYWNDCAYFFKTLKQHGFLQANIHVLFADGTDPAIDNSAGQSSPLDFDGDGIDDIGFSATKANITVVFDQLAATLGAGDILYIFTTDHGSAAPGNVAPYDDPDVVLVLWGEDITGDELATELNKVTAKAVAGIFEQCFSGGLVEKLAGSDRVVMSASRWWELSYAMGPDYNYDEFSYYVTKALAEPARGDTNGDPATSMEEAYLYALARDSHQSEALDGWGDNEGEHPSYRSEPWDLGRKLSLLGLDENAPAPEYAGYVQSQGAPEYPPLGTAKGWQADDAYWNHPLPFPFTLRGQRYTSVHVSSNGILYFAAPSVSGENSVNGLAAAVAIAPLWDDLTTACGGCDIHVATDDDSITFAWKAATVADARPVNTAARLNRDGSFTLYYGTGNAHIGRVAGRDKTIGVSTGKAMHLSLSNGLSDLGSAAPVTFQAAPMRGAEHRLWQPALAPDGASGFSDLPRQERPLLQ